MILFGAYLLGSIPTAYLITRLTCGEDIRQSGDGNVGAKNTFVSVSRFAGFMVCIIDILKGVLAVSIASLFNFSDNIVFLSGLCAVIGHDFSIFLNFQGGQGMAVIVGIFGYFFSLQTVASVFIFFVVLIIFKNWNLSCFMGFVIFTLLIFLTASYSDQSFYPVFIFLVIGLKKLLQDWRTRRKVA
jgi:glycerol-3-phosphate acyltransferase PlsY